VDHVGAAIVLAQPVVDRPRIEEDEIAPASRLGGLEQHIGWKIQNEKRNAAIGELQDDVGRVGSVLDAHLLKQKMLVEKFARRVVIVEREARTGNAVIVGWIIEERDLRLFLGASHISDLDGERLRPRERCGQEENQRCRHDCPDQSPARRLRLRHFMQRVLFERVARIELKRNPGTAVPHSQRGPAFLSSQCGLPSLPLETIEYICSYYRKNPT